MILKYVKVSQIAMCLLGAINAAAVSYENNGLSWASDAASPACGKGTAQSPIDLDSKMKSRQEEHFFKHYENINGDTTNRYTYGAGFGYKFGELHFSEKSSAIYATLDNKGLGGPNAPTPDPVAPDYFANPNWFNSSEGYTTYDADQVYYTKQLHFHTKSEHSIDGKLKDLEMHIVHQSPNKTADQVDNKDPEVQEKKWPVGKLAVIGVMFDTKNYDKVNDETVAAIDKFFDSIIDKKLSEKDDQDKWNKPVVPMIPLGEMMAYLNTSHRWVYNGSLTTPPCYENVYWNVLTTVYPIKQKHMDLYLEILKKRADPTSQSVEKGNNRLPRLPKPSHFVRRLRPLDPFIEKKTEPVNEILLVVVSLAIIAVLYLIGYIIYIKCTTKKAGTVSPGDVEMNGKYNQAVNSSQVNASQSDIYQTTQTAPSAK